MTTASLLLCWTVRSIIYWIHMCFFFKQKTAYDMLISDWSSDVCSSDLSGKRWSQSQGCLAHTAMDAAADLLECDRQDIFADILGEGSRRKIGRPSCRERASQYVSISAVGVSLKRQHVYNMICAVAYTTTIIKHTTKEDVSRNKVI